MTRTPARRAFMPLAALAFVTTVTTVLLGACGGGGGGGDAAGTGGTGGTGVVPPVSPPPTTPAPPTTPGAGTTRLFIGYYAESAANNPEDPTVGPLFFRVPASDGAFSGVMPFTYLGCSGGVSLGTIAGMRSGSTLSGNWTGTLDGQAVSGGYSGSFAADGASVTGGFTSATGKQPIVAPPCNYFLAASGSFRVFDGPAREPASVVLTVGAGTTQPGFTWTGVPAVATMAVRVFDEACLESASAGAACFLGEAFTTAAALAYPADFPGAKVLAPGGRYVAVLTAQSPSVGASAQLVGYASVRFTP